MNNKIKPKINRAEHPDKAAFRAFIGAFLLIACIPLANWAYYNYGEYQHTTAFVQKLRESSEQFLTPNEREERKNRIAIDSSRARRYRLEMILSGAGGLVLFGISLLLFRGALKARKNKQSPQFEPIDWRATPIPSERVEVRQKRFYDVLFAFFIIFFGGLALLNFILTVRSQFSTTSDIVVKGVLFSGFCLLLLAFMSFLIIRAKRKAVRLFDVSGVTRGDGRHFPWNEFQGVVTRIDINLRTWQKYVWRIELAFAGGEKAWIIPNRIKNAGEVFTYVAALPRTVLKNSQ
jgi:hypothetical protein